jgi:hypothetical protein
MELKQHNLEYFFTSLKLDDTLNKSNFRASTATRFTALESVNT